MTLNGRRIVFAAALLIGVPAIRAQLSSSVSVEGEYQPIIIDTDRLSSFPAGYRFELPPAALQYELSGIVADFRPDILTMGATGRLTAQPWSKRHGWVDFNAGSWLNTRLDAGTYILSDEVNTLKATLDFMSSSLWRTRNVPYNYSEPGRKRLYEGRIGVDYSRLFGEEGLLKADIGYGLGYFNYYGTVSGPHDTRSHIMPSVDIPTQTVNSAEAAVSYASTPSTIKGWHAELQANYLGYRRLYSPLTSKQSSKGEKETQLQAGAGYAFNFAESSAIAIDAEGTFLFYPKTAPEALDIASPEKRNYGVVALKPSYRFAGNRLSLRAGADLSFSYDAMGNAPDRKFGLFHAAPDVAIEYRSPAGVGIALKATGGVTPSTLNLRRGFDRYQLPWVLSTQPVYSPIDATFGLNIGPFAGFAGSVSLRYAIADNVPLGGWYQAYIGAYTPSLAVTASDTYLDPYRQNASLKGLEVGLDLRYAFGTMVELSFEGAYSPQNGTRGIFNGFDRPRWVLDTRASVRPIKRLKIEAGYAYRGVRNCYRWESEGSDFTLTPYRLPDITDLNARITFSILDNLDIYCKGENLLNRHVDLLPGLQSEGIVIAGGIYFEF